MRKECLHIDWNEQEDIRVFNRSLWKKTYLICFSILIGLLLCFGLSKVIAGAVEQNFYDDSAQIISTNAKYSDGLVVSDRCDIVATGLGSVITKGEITLKNENEAEESIYIPSSSLISSSFTGADYGTYQVVYKHNDYTASGSGTLNSCILSFGDVLAYNESATITIDYAGSTCPSGAAELATATIASGSFSNMQIEHDVAIKQAYAVYADNAITSTDKSITLAAGSLNFFYDYNKNMWATLGGDVYDMNTDENTPGWNEHKTDITKVNISSSFAGYQPTTCCEWFSGFNNASLTTIDLSNLDTSKCTSFKDMFASCSTLTSLDVSGLATNKVTNMTGTFYKCSGLGTIDCGAWDTSSCTLMKSMFQLCSGLTSLDVSNFNTSKVTSFETMFSECYNLNTLNINGFDITSATNLNYMFISCTSLITIYCSEDWSGTSATNSQMFYYDTLLPHYNSSYTGKTYAYPDNGVSGYFTPKTVTISLGGSGNFHYENTSGATITTISGETGGSVKVKVVCDSGYEIDTISDNAGNTYTPDASGYITIPLQYNYTITTTVKVSASLNYVVSIWGIEQDGTNTVTFGPATGSSNTCLDKGCGSEHCIHTDSWDEICENINNGHAHYYDNCLTNNCSANVPITPNTTLFNTSTITSALKGSILYNTVNSSYRAWNKTYSSSDCESANWATSRIRATLNGASGSESSYAEASTCLSSSNCLLSCFPSALQSNIKAKSYRVPTAWNTSSSGGYSITSYTDVEDKLWLPNAMEVYSDISSSNYNYYYYSDSSYGTTQYTKKANEGTSTSSYSSNIGYNESGSSDYWWLRCPYRNYRCRAGYVRSDGGLNGSYVSNTGYGLSACFIL